MTGLARNAEQSIKPAQWACTARTYFPGVTEQYDGVKTTHKHSVLVVTVGLAVILPIQEVG